MDAEDCEYYSALVEEIEHDFRNERLWVTPRGTEPIRSLESSHLKNIVAFLERGGSPRQYHKKEVLIAEIKRRECKDKINKLIEWAEQNKII